MVSMLRMSAGQQADAASHIHDTELARSYRAHAQLTKATATESGVTEPDPAAKHDATTSPVDHPVKSLERWQLLCSAVPLIAAGLGVAGLYAFFATSSDRGEFWIGVPLGLVGSLLAAIGYRGRLRELRSPSPSTGRHYPWLFLGWVGVVAGLLIPPYALA